MFTINLVKEASDVGSATFRIKQMPQVMVGQGCTGAMSIWNLHTQNPGTRGTTPGSCQLTAENNPLLPWGGLAAN